MDSAVAKMRRSEAAFRECILTNNIDGARQLANEVIDRFGGVQTSRAKIVNSKSPKAIYKALLRTLTRGNHIGGRGLATLDDVLTPAERQHKELEKSTAIKDAAQDELTQRLLDL